MSKHWSCVLVVAAFLVTRPLFYALLLHVFGADPVRDFMYFNGLMDDWRSGLLRTATDDQYPPGLGLMLQLGNWWSLPHPLDVRASLMLWDFMATALMVWWAWRVKASFGLLLLLALFLMPLTSIWAQDEVVSASFLLLIWLALGRDRIGLALMISLFALACAKLFFLPLCLLLVVQSWNSSRTPRFLVCFSVLTLAVILLWQFGGHKGISNFVPPNDFGISLWSLHAAMSYPEASEMYRASLVLFLLVGTAWGVFVLRYLRAGREACFLAYALTMHIFTLTFYHINPEYLVFFAVPYLLLAASNSMRWIALVFLAWAMAWLVNALYFICRTHPDLVSMHHGVLVLFNLTSLSLLAVTLYKTRMHLDLNAHSRDENPAG